MSTEDNQLETQVALNRQRLDANDEVFRELRNSLCSINDTLKKMYDLDHRAQNHNGRLESVESTVQNLKKEVDEEIKPPIKDLPSIRKFMFYWSTGGVVGLLIAGVSVAGVLL